jgi:DNA modification methylase
VNIVNFGPVIDHQAVTPTTIVAGHVLAGLAQIATGSVQCAVTSQPYWSQRDYRYPGQLGGEATLEGYVANLVSVFREVRRCLANHGTLWLNLGDAYISNPGGTGCSGQMADRAAATSGARRTAREKVPGLKVKDLIGLPWRVAFALQADGWYLRSSIVWSKPNASPESVRDRPTSSYELVFLLAKTSIYYHDPCSVSEPAIWDRASPGDRRQSRDVWSIATQPFRDAHFAMMQIDLAERCIKAGSRPGDLVLDPFLGAGTTALAANRTGRLAVGCELNDNYVDLTVRTLATAGFSSAVF